ncbi:MAG: SDR family NAD(P)-dependent oxidoreductase [Pseudomonadota bacterium]
MFRAVNCFILTVVAALSLTISAHGADATDQQKSILVTGASTGIGRNLAETLASSGYHVYAGARKAEDLAALDAIDNITAVRLDVRHQEEIDAVAALIRKRGTGLYALVNNAGVGGGGPVLSTPVDEQTFIYDVNVEGVYRVTRTLAPLVIESKGRIATTGSIAGTLAWPAGNAYSGSKHWIEAFTDALAGEMAAHGVSVSVIEPGNYQSHIRRSALLRRFDRIIAEGGEMTPTMEAQLAATTERELSFKLPDEVSAAYMHALFDEAPLRRYMVVPSAEEQQVTIATKIQQLVQLNQWGPHRYSDEQLLAMLTEALEETP